MQILQTIRQLLSGPDTDFSAIADDRWADGLPWTAREILEALEWSATDSGKDLEERAARLRRLALERG